MKEALALQEVQQTSLCRRRFLVTLNSLNIFGTRDKEVILIGVSTH